MSRLYAGSSRGVQPQMRQQAPSLRQRIGLSLHAARTVSGWGARQARGLLLATVAAAFMTAIGALGSDRMPLVPRFGYWLLLMISGTLMGLGILAGARRHGWLENRPVLQGAAITLSLWAPQTLAVCLVGAAVFRQPLTARYLLGNAIVTLVISAAMMALNYLADRTPVQTHALRQGAQPVRFLNRLPPGLRGAEVWAVEAEDHYLRVHTSQGQDLMLVRLSDAVAELEGIEGAQVHRSWWVARDAIIDVRRGNGRATLKLKGDVEAPVSRTYARALREAGWI
jgi:hypothetical protein